MKWEFLDIDYTLTINLSILDFKEICYKYKGEFYVL